MGCGASKEASPSTVGVAATSTTPKSPATPSAVEAAVASGRNGGKTSVPQQQQQQQQAASSTTNVPNANNNNTSSAPASAAVAAASASSTSTMTDQQKADALKAGLLMVQLNDVVPGSTQGGAGNNRGRFLSYASGASTPNTSQGNLSWSSETGDSGGGGGGGGPGDSDKDSTDGGSGGGGGGRSPQQSPSRSGGQHHHRSNPKMLKKSHSGSAIDLENLHREKSCTLTSKVVHIEVPFGKPIEEVYDGVHVSSCKYYSYCVIVC